MNKDLDFNVINTAYTYQRMRKIKNNRILATIAISLAGLVSGVMGINETSRAIDLKKDIDQDRSAYVIFQEFIDTAQDLQDYEAMYNLLKQQTKLKDQITEKEETKTASATTAVVEYFAFALLCAWSVLKIKETAAGIEKAKAAQYEFTREFRTNLQTIENYSYYYHVLNMMFADEDGEQKRKQFENASAEVRDEMVMKFLQETLQKEDPALCDHLPIALFSFQNYLAEYERTHHVEFIKLTETQRANIASDFVIEYFEKNKTQEKY